MPNLNSVCVFCGSSPGRDPAFMKAAGEMGALLALRGITVVYGGGNIGMMGRVADSALEAGGRVVGVIPSFMTGREISHTGLTELHVVGSMHERKAMMERLSDGLVTLPGGIGTFEEFCEMLAWAQLGLHAKPCGLLNVAGFYDPMIMMLDRAVESGFIKPKHRALLVVAEDSAKLLSLMESQTPPQVEQLLERGRE